MAGYSDDGTPIYLQIVKRILARIMSGDLAPGERLPSVREGADAYRVNPNTMQRVMTELEREGVVTSTRGIGFFVTDDPALVARLRRAEAARATKRYFADMVALGLDHDDIRDLVHTNLGGSRP